ncbi:MAG: peptidoglycan-binding domain-containing protein, partial [Solirubrobacteraceae bacterium]|nr:peptidoglycan-binding domain-containing protein [Solirubrobacteraceae bacterium]
MRNPITRATLVAVLLVLSTAPSAFAAQNTGGASVGGSSASTGSQSGAAKAQAPADVSADAAAADPIVVQPVKLTSSQTKSVQRRVKVKPDGALGSRTRKAIKKYQRVQALTLTGSPNVETLRAMKLKIADKLEAKLRAEASGETADGAAVNQPVALAAPTGS